MKPVDDELFAQIKESLTEHEEAYVPGAWERFEKKERKGRGLLWLLSVGSAAAVLLIGIVLFYNDHTPVDRLQQQVKNKGVEINSDPQPDTAPIAGKPGTAIENLNIKIGENKNIVTQRVNNKVANDPLIVGTKNTGTSYVDTATAAPLVSTTQAPVSNSNAIALAENKGVKPAFADSAAMAKVPAKEKEPVKEPKPHNFQEFLDAEVKNNSKALATTKSTARKADKWDLGVMVAPSIGNGKKLNMGYGVSMDYALSARVSISSGISYNEMGASKDMTRSGSEIMNNPGPVNAMVQDTKSLESVDANLVGIDIPLGIKYFLTNKFYTNVGVSAFAVLNQKQSNNYLQGAVEQRMAADQPAGFSAVYQQRAISEPVPSGEIRGGKYLGFYNISFGYQQKISGSKAFSVEPFLKLPMKEFTKENLYLLGTGVRLKFDF
uniref:hypothetical protein n=1 Tax=Pedobacter schmidteae TaxID=2201271 RepID=UPI000EAF2B2F|nr:hypothetical protein [Pedobacter schmidteae]